MLNCQKIGFSSSAKHVGILRSIKGNMPNILARLSAHKKAVMSILPTGMACGHPGNPAAGLRLERLYGCPVLLSGLPALVLSALELSIVHQHHKSYLERIQRLHQATPECVVMFLAGSLPATGVLHLRLLSLLGMIARLGPDNILHQHGRHVLLAPESSKYSQSWFIQIRKICQQYHLQDPLLILQSQPTTYQWKTLTKSRVLDWWELKFRGEASHLDSLLYFNPHFMSLSKPHPIWTSAGSPFEVSKAVISARMLSGRYRTDQLTRHWSRTNPEGTCRLPGCDGSTLGSLEHILLHCPALAHTRAKLISHWSNFLVPRPWLLPVISQYTLNGDHLQLQLLLDASCLPLVISSSTTNPNILPSCLYLARTWNFSIHLTREKLMRQWNLKN